MIVAGGDGTLVRAEAASGRQLWRIKAGMDLTAGVGTDGNVIVVGGAKGMLLAFDMDGKQLWKAQLSSEILSSPVVGQGIVVARSIDNRIVGFDAKTGQKKWTVQRTAPPLTLRLAPGMVVHDKDVIIAQPGGKLLSLILATGAPRWEIEVGVARGATELERVTDIGGYPVVFEDDVCAVSYQGRVGCFDLPTGSPRWTRDLSSRSRRGRRPALRVRRRRQGRRVRLQPRQRHQRLEERQAGLPPPVDPGLVRPRGRGRRLPGLRALPVARGRRLPGPRRHRRQRDQLDARWWPART